LAKIETKVKLESISTEIEKKLALIWSKLLNVDLNEIGRNTSFFELGGDSISAIQMISMGKEVDLNIAPGVVFKKPTLSQLAAIADVPVKEFVIKPLNISQDILEEIYLCLGTEETEIDIYPVTPLQAGIIAQTIQNPSAYVNQIKWKVLDSLDKKLLKSAVQIVAKAHDILRTRFVNTTKGLYQVLQSSVELSLNEAVDLDSYCKADLKKGFELKDQVWFRVGVTEDLRKETHIILTIHHALYDGWCLNRIIQDIFAAYGGQMIQQSVPFKRLVEYNESQDQQQGQKFWEEYLCEANLGLKLKLPMPQEDSTVSFVKRISKNSTLSLNRVSKQNQLTVAVLAKAAWAITLKHYLQETDITFGSVSSGREIQLSGIQE
jgi:acyl carrier protein